MLYSEEIIEEVRQRNDIVDVISSYVRLQKKGSNYFGLCPFHNEKSPSFSVSPLKQMYYCFGCGAGGNVLTFVMEYENETFVEAMKTLAERAGITLPERELDAEERRALDMKSVLLEIHKKAARFYFYRLTKSRDGGQAMSYLTGRGLSEETISRFGLGYSPLYADALYKYLKNEHYSDEMLKNSGLFVMNEKGVYDRFWNRVMYPIMDKNNKVIGFGGRVLGDGEPKYLNSPETPIFDKSRNLYGLHEAKHSRKPYMLVCEGYMDVIALHQAGFTNSVASLGTAFTIQHAMILKRYTQEVILTYDSDGAGVKAALRAIPILKEAGIRTKVLNMKPYKDPDEFIKNLGGEAFEERIAQAMNSFLYEIQVLRDGFDMNDPEQKTQFYYGAARKLLEFPEELERSSYMEVIAKEYNIPLESLKKLVFRMSNSAAYRPPAAEKTHEENGGTPRKKAAPQAEGIQQSQRLLLAWIAQEPQLYEHISGWLAPEDFEGEMVQKIAGMLFEQAKAQAVNPAQILNQLMENEEQYKDAGAFFFSGVIENMEESQREQILNDTIKKIKKHSLERAARSAASVEELQRLISAQKALEKLYIAL